MEATSGDLARGVSHCVAMSIVVGALHHRNQLGDEALDHGGLPYKEQQVDPVGDTSAHLQ